MDNRSIKNLIVKFAKLTDQQYKEILEDYGKKKLLYDKNLIDEFYKARPDKTEEELLQDLEIKKTMFYNMAPIEIKEENVKQFLDSFGNETLDVSLLENLHKYIARTESFGEKEIYGIIDNMRKYKIRDIIYLLYKSIGHSTKQLDEFIDSYKKLDDLIVNNRGSDDMYVVEKIKAYEQIVAQRAYFLFQQINKISRLNVDKPIHELAFSKLEESIKLRNSNLFDFVYEDSQDASEDVA